MEDQTITAAAWVAGLPGVGFVWRSLTFSNPVVDLRALKDRNFGLGYLFSFVTGIGIFVTVYLTPLFLGRVRGLSALRIGAADFTTGTFQILAIPLYGIAVPPVVTLALGSLPLHMLKNASGLFNLMLGRAMGIAACGTIPDDRTYLHFLCFVEHLNAANSAMANQLRPSPRAAPS